MNALGMYKEWTCFRHEDNEVNGCQIEIACIVSERKPRLSPIGIRLSQIGKRATQKRLAFHLTEENCLQFWMADCHYCGHATPNLNLDRIDSKQGYTLDNVVPCCKLCNVMKTDMSVDDFKRRIQKIHDHLCL